METFQTFIVVFIIFIAAFYLLRVSVFNRDKTRGCCGDDCGGCSRGGSCSETEIMDSIPDNRKGKK